MVNNYVRKWVNYFLNPMRWLTRQDFVTMLEQLSACVEMIRNKILINISDKYVTFRKLCLPPAFEVNITWHDRWYRNHERDLVSMIGRILTRQVYFYRFRIKGWNQSSQREPGALLGKAPCKFFIRFGSDLSNFSTETC